MLYQCWASVEDGGPTLVRDTVGQRRQTSSEINGFFLGPVHTSGKQFDENGALFCVVDKGTRHTCFCENMDGEQQQQTSYIINLDATVIPAPGRRSPLSVTMAPLLSDRLFI